MISPPTAMPIYCYICLLAQEKEVQTNASHAVTIFNGMALCGVHVTWYAQEEWVLRRLRELRSQQITQVRPDPPPRRADIGSGWVEVTQSNWEA